MVFITIVPNHFNDGTPVSQNELDEIFLDFTNQFGGGTIDGLVNGQWIDDRDGRLYKDEGFRLTVNTSRDRLQDAQEAVLEMGRRLGQEAVYFEVRYFDGVQILRVN